MNYLLGYVFGLFVMWGMFRIRWPPFCAFCGKSLLHLGEHFHCPKCGSITKRNADTYEVQKCSHDAVC